MVIFSVTSVTAHPVTIVTGFADIPSARRFVFHKHIYCMYTEKVAEQSRQQKNIRCGYPAAYSATRIFTDSPADHGNTLSGIVAVCEGYGYSDLRERSDTDIGLDI